VVTRREWLKLSVAAGVGLLGCSAENDNDGGCPPLDPDHAVATFEVDDQSAIVSAYAAGGGLATVTLTLPDGSERNYGPLELAIDRGNTGELVLDNLMPNTSYSYVLAFEGGTVSSTCHFRTAPVPTESADYSLLFSADIDVCPEFDSPIFDAMARTDAAFFVCLGDWPYADNPPGPETLAEYRARYKQVRGAGKVQRLVARMPTYAIYDDHEVWNNWDGALRQSQPERVQMALRAWDEWFPLRSDNVRYRKWKWGRDTELFLLDTRLYRSANADPDGPNKTMLGAAQRDWLLNGLETSTAAFKLIFTTVPLKFARSLAPFPDDHWGVFTTERDAIWAYIRDNNISGVVFLTADQHWFAAHHFTEGHIEFQVGPLARGIPELPPAGPEVVARSAQYNFGEIRIRPGSPPELQFNCRDANGELIYSETILG